MKVAFAVAILCFGPSGVLAATGALAANCADVRLNDSAFATIGGAMSETDVTALLGCNPSDSNQTIDSIGITTRQVTWSSPNKTFVIQWRRGSIASKQRYGRSDDVLNDAPPDLVSEFDPATHILRIRGLRIVGSAATYTGVTLSVPPGRPWRVVDVTDPSGTYALPQPGNELIAAGQLLNFAGLEPRGIFAIPGGGTWMSIDCNIARPERQTTDQQQCVTNPFTGQQTCTTISGVGTWKAAPDTPSVRVYQVGYDYWLDMQGVTAACRVERVLY